MEPKGFEQIKKYLREHKCNICDIDDGGIIGKADFSEIIEIMLKFNLTIGMLRNEKNTKNLIGMIYMKMNELFCSTDPNSITNIIEKYNKIAENPIDNPITIFNNLIGKYNCSEEVNTQYCKTMEKFLGINYSHIGNNYVYLVSGRVTGLLEKKGNHYKIFKFGPVIKSISTKGLGEFSANGIDSKNEYLIYNTELSTSNSNKKLGELFMEKELVLFDMNIQKSFKCIAGYKDPKIKFKNSAINGQEYDIDVEFYNVLFLPVKMPIK